MGIVIKQFTNRKKQKVAGKTPEHAVYDENDVRLDYKLKSLNNNIKAIVIEYLKEHPEMIVALQDGSVTVAKLAEDVYSWLVNLGDRIKEESSNARQNEQELYDKFRSIEKTLDNITKTGEASSASNVTLQSISGIVATNVQDAISEIVNDASKIKTNTEGLEGNNIQENLTELSRDVSELEAKQNDLTSFSFEASHEFTGRQFIKYFENLGIKKGQKFKMLATGAATWAAGRLNVFQGTWLDYNFICNLTKDEVKEFIADVDINELTVYFNYTSGYGTVDLKVYNEGTLSKVVDDVNAINLELPTIKRDVEELKPLPSRVTNLETSKVNVSDIVNRLDQDIPNQPLSAAKGRELNISCSKLTNIGYSILHLYESYNLINKDVLISGYLIDGGSTNVNDNYLTSTFIPVKKGENITYKSESGQSNRRYVYSYCFYDSKYDFILYSGDTHNITSIIVPDNDSIRYIRVTIYATALDTAILVRGTSVDTYENYNPKIPYSLLKDIPEPKVDDNQVSISGDIYAGQSLGIDSMSNTVSRNELYVFNANINSFESIEIGAYNPTSTVRSYGAKVVIDNTNISVYDYSGSIVANGQKAHGLNISGNIQIILETDNLYGLKVTLISTGEMAQHVCAWTKRGMCYPRVTSINSILTKCKLTWTCKHIKKDIWMFGDSYFSYTDRWPYYLHKFGFDDNVLMDAYPGESSVIALVSLKHLLEIHKPKMIVWCHGMNDGSDGDTPSTSWITPINELIQICKDYKVELVLATIPSVPSINHTKKNAFVKSFGYRYIDFNNAVGASSDGSWFVGMLSSDNIHPTNKGAKALFGRVLVDLPEVSMSK